MSLSYRAVNWNTHKKVYDLVMGANVIAFVAIFFVVGKILWQGSHAISDPILLMRAFGVSAIILLHVILCIGPAARFHRGFAPLLYNRRHLGVTTFLLALAHAGLALLFYGGFGVRNPVFAMLGRGEGFASISGFPFEWLGAAALAILFLMASTSHDFWLANLTPRVWKGLHMLVYLAYALVILHVVLGVLQSERSLVYPVLLGAGAILVSSLHIAAGLKSHRERRACSVEGVGWIDIGSVDDIQPGRAKRVCLQAGGRVAVFRHDAGISAISDVCAHQGGPLSEGKIIDGCITCPWHGYQYLPANGQSPPPFTEKLATYEVRLDGRRILLNPVAQAPGTPVPPAPIEPSTAS